MGETKIILISKRWPQGLLQRFQESLGLAPKKVSQRLSRTYGKVKEKTDNKKT